MRFFPLVALFLAGIVQAKAQNDIDSVVKWSPDRKLQTTDFRKDFHAKARMMGEANHVSQLLDINVFVSDYEKGDPQFHYLIYPEFYQYSSWLNDTARLAHEQLHFDISELYARKMRFAIDSMARNHPRSLRYAKRVLNNLYDEHMNFQARYERETNYGKFLNMQIFWKRKVDKALASYKLFAKEEATITLNYED